MPVVDYAAFKKNYSNTKFDFVICGGGATGSVLAARLSERLGTGRPHTVLMLEAGKHHGKNSRVGMYQNIPAGFPNNLNDPKTDWMYATVPQANCAGRVMLQSRPMVAGGAGTCNALMHMTPTLRDMSRWAEFDEQWSCEQMKAYYDKAHGVTNESTGKLEGHTLYHGLESYPSKLSQPFINAANEELGHTKDHMSTYTANGRVVESGAAKTKTYIREGARQSTYGSYLPDDTREHRGNLVILTEVVVDRIELASSSGFRANAVVFRTSSGVHKVAVGREAILTAGTFGSAQILQRSGVFSKGDSQHLPRDVGPCHIDLPIGHNLSDHLAYGITWESKQGTSLQSMLSGLRKIAAAAQVLFSHEGPMTSNIGESIALVRSDNAPVFTGAGIATHCETHSTQGSPDIELILFPISVGPDATVLQPPNHDCMTIQVLNLAPQSRGTIYISSMDPSAKPVIDPKYLQAPNDLEVMVKGARLALQIAKNNHLKPHLVKIMTGGAWHPVDFETKVGDELDQALRLDIRARCQTIWHNTGTVAMGTCVDPKTLLLHKTSNVCVADASVVPYPLSAHPMGTLVPLAEKAAALILSRHPH